MPEDLQVGNIKTKEHEGDLVFQSEHSWLSNFFPSPVSLQGIDFHSAEQAFQYVKACRNKQPEMASLILNTKSAKAAKKLGWGVERNKEWDQQKDEIMVRIVNAKFRQNIDLGRKLILTGSKRLVEATMDRYWGAFATPNAKSIANKTWKGANRLGLILMDLRAELRREHPEVVRETIPDQTAGAVGGQVPIDPQSQSTEVPEFTKPTPPARTKKSARKRDEVSPQTYPPAARQKTDSVPASQVINNTIGSPTTSALVPPIGDLFEPVGNFSVKVGRRKHGKSSHEAASDILLPSQPKDEEHAVFIGSQEI